MPKNSKCPKCEYSNFELAPNRPKGSNYDFYFVQCAGCGAVVGVMESHNLSTLLHQLAKKLGVSL